ncbi:EAL domain-containing protein [Bradyrhizobium sp. Tv2a-2]|uniref:bifunctional diguanylate cyclase/phosphodiesterase n=1 Tax=Bradyrhizobium sp. Tv2a-2 TaxID=113395 RepID=UPI0003FB7D84|nr:EAL domain-containing protein [Bradyrhizobium sp. Tv2a-2]
MMRSSWRTKWRFWRGGSGWRPTVATATLGFVLIVCTIIVGLETSRILEQRADYLADARRDNENLLKSLIHHADLTFRTADTLLTGVVERLEHGDLAQAGGRERVASWFQDEVARNPELRGFAVVDRQGALIANSQRNWQSVDDSDREYFRYHVSNPSQKPYIGAPIRGRNVRDWVIPVSRRFNKEDGSFGGVAVVLIRPGHFQDFYQQLDIGEKGAILLATRSGRLLARRPFDEANVGKDLSQSGIFQELQTSKSGFVEVKSSTDGVVRFNSYQESELYPLVLAVAQSTSELLAPWRARAEREAFGTAIIVLVIALLGFFVRKMASRLGEVNGLFELALSNMPNGLIMFDSERRVVISNQRFRDMYGLGDEQVRPGTPLRSLLESHVRNGQTSDLSIDDYIDSVMRISTQTQPLVDGRTVFIRRNKICRGGWIATHEDITEHKRDADLLVANAATLEQTNARFDAAINNMAQGVCLFDAEQRVVVSNRRYAEIYHLSPEQILPGVSLPEILELRRRAGTHFELDPGVYMAEHTKQKAEVRELADGRIVSISRHMMPDGGWLTTHEDITDRARNEQKIAYLAEHDLLTGLPNRAFLTKMLEGPIFRRDNVATDDFAVFMLDLDRFKNVNDTLGHAAGDQLLIEVARRLKASLRDSDILARLGGDEFAIIQPLEGHESERDHETTIALALRIVDTIARPIDLDGHQVTVGTSIGIARSPFDGRERKDLLKKADLALYAAKADGRNDFRLYRPEMMKSAETHKIIENELREAISKGQFELYYQPIIDVRSQTVCGGEALVRWRHPQRGLVDPDKFIPVAEASGLIIPLGDWILQQACKDAADWPEPLRVSVNLSAFQFNKGNLFDVVLCALVESALNPERLELEITESALLDNQSSHLQTIRQLKNLGITMALDDFGTGYSSASYLTNFPFDKIKIDKSFIQGAERRRDCTAVIASVLALARGLEMAVTAEGVETEHQFQMLRKAGVEYAQGFLFARPVPQARFMAEFAAPLRAAVVPATRAAGGRG